MFFCNEEDAPSPAQPREAVVDIDIDAWQQAIGTVELANGTQTSTIVRPEEDGLLDLSELSTLFAKPVVAAAFDPDTVIESVLANEEPQKESDNFDPDAVFTSLEEQDLDEAAPIAVDEESAFDDFAPDAVLASLEEQDLNETAPIAVDPIERDAKAIELEAETEQPSSEVSMTTTCLETEAEDVKLPRLVIPSLQPVNQSFFASQLFDTWQRLARQKLLAQKRPEAEPWGMAVELNQIYQVQFAAMMGAHFLQRVQDVVLAPAPADGKSIQLIATPGIVNQRVAGVDANAISYVQDRWHQAPAKPVASHTNSEPSQPATLQTQPHLESERARLLKERQRRMEAMPTTAKPQRWWRRWGQTLSL